MGAILLLLLLSVTWVMGLLTVNFDLPALSYVHTLFLFLQGVFLFIVYILLSRKVGGDDQLSLFDHALLCLRVSKKVGGDHLV